MIACTLGQNALDYLLLAGEQASTYTPRMLKHALATLADGVELLVKAPLEKKDWKLLFAKKEAPDEDKYCSGNFRSIEFFAAITLLEEECGIYLTDSQMALIKRLRDLRNQIRHFAVSVDQNAAVSLIARSYKFACEFVQSCSIAETGVSDPQFQSVSNQFSGFVDKRLAEIKPEMERDGWTVHVPCPMCLQPALHADGNRCHCRFCEADIGAEETAIAWVGEFAFRWPKDVLIEPSIHYCPECGNRTFVNVGGIGTKSIGFFCFCCGEHGQCIHCEQCSELFLPDNVSFDGFDEFDPPWRDTKCHDCRVPKFGSLD
jgi:hypothetical protein